MVGVAGGLPKGCACSRCVALALSWNPWCPTSPLGFLQETPRSIILTRSIRGEVEAKEIFWNPNPNPPFPKKWLSASSWSSHNIPNFGIWRFANENLQKVVWNILCLYRYLGRWSNLTSMFQLGLKPPNRICRRKASPQFAKCLLLVLVQVVLVLTIAWPCPCQICGFRCWRKPKMSTLELWINEKLWYMSCIYIYISYVM